MTLKPESLSVRRDSAGRRGFGVWLTVTLLILIVGGCAGPEQGEGSIKTPTLFAWWPPYPDEPRIQFLASYQHSEDLLGQSQSSFERALFGSEAKRIIPVKKPYGVDMWNGSIYVCDIRGQQVVVFDVRDREVRVMGTTGLQTLSQASDIAISPDGMKYVTDGLRGVVFVFDANDRYITMFGWPGFKPTGVAVHGDRLYVCDFASQSVQILNRRNGERLGQIGERGPDDGQFVKPLGIDVDQEGNVYVSDVIKCRLQKFNPDGELIMAFGNLSDEFGSFYRPKHIAVDSSGNLFVADSSFQNVQVFNPEGQVLTFFGSAGPHPGSMFLPVGLAVIEDPADIADFQPYAHPDFVVERLVVVTNQMGDNRVSVYGFGHLREGVTAADIQRQAAAINMGLSTGAQNEAIGLPPQPAPEQGNEPAADQRPPDSQPPE